MSTSIIKDLQQVKPLNSASISAIVDISNDNFAKIARSVYDFLTNIQYDEVNNNITVNELDAAVVSVNKKLNMLVEGSEMFSVDTNGRVWSKSYVAEDIIQTKRMRLSQFTGAPNTTVGGEIIYGQIYTDSSQTVLSQLDFWGYVQNLGWFSLTGNSSSGFIPTSNAIWVGQVVDIVSTPPAYPAVPGLYAIDWNTAANGIFIGHEGEIAVYDFGSLTWSFLKPSVGSAFTNMTQFDRIYVRQYGEPPIWSASAGYSGYSGYSGNAGLSGYSGYSGKSGIDGIVGASGYSGYSGKNGNDGASGYTGTSGLSGYSGVSGQRGYSGFSGNYGQSGYSGKPGLSGYSGNAGLSGASG